MPVKPVTDVCDPADTASLRVEEDKDGIRFSIWTEPGKEEIAYVTLNRRRAKWIRSHITKLLGE